MCTHCSSAVWQRILYLSPTLFREVKVGDPKDPNNMLGALVSKEHMAKVKGYIELARSEGCTILCGDGVDELSLPELNKNVRYVYMVYTSIHEKKTVMVGPDKPAISGQRLFRAS